MSLNIKEGGIYYRRKSGMVLVALIDSSPDDWWRLVPFRRLKGNTALYMERNNVSPIEDILPPKDLLVYELSGILPKNIYALAKEKAFDKKLKMSDNTEN